MPDIFRFRPEFLPRLAQVVPGILKTQDRETGRFGTGIWLVTDQNVIFPLAAAWATPGTDCCHAPEILEAILKGGDALIDDQDARGMWVFRKKDGSTWGDIYMPWTYSRWIRAYALIRDAAIDPVRRSRWESALQLGYDGISRTAFGGSTANIPAHHAMGLYCAGTVFERPDWCAQASEFMAKVVAAQNPGGFWSEHSGPVVIYNYVYIDAIGAYYALSGDNSVLLALERSARFHSALTYPDGSSVETVDERQVYHPGITMPGAGFSFSDAGRGYISEQWERVKVQRNGELAPDTLAGFVLYASDGPAEPTPSGQAQGQAILGENDALLRRETPWFVALSAYHAPVTNNRWIQDRQNFVSVFHDRTGLILGGGNTKLQPLWSTFTVGDITLLCHQPGGESPNFLPPDGISHVPSETRLDPGSTVLELVYGPQSVRCRIEVVIESPERLRLIVSAEGLLPGNLPVEAHLTFLGKLRAGWETAAGAQGLLSEIPLALVAEEVSGWFAHNGWRIVPPPDSTVRWPVLPHDPYVKEGTAALEEGRIVLCIPLTQEHTKREVAIEIVGE